MFLSLFSNVIINCNAYFELKRIVKKDSFTITSDKKRELLLKIKIVTNYIKLKYCISYLQTCYGTNSHCPIYVVSDPKCDKLSLKCKELHNESSSDCCNILEIFSQIKQFCDKELNQELKEHLLYDINAIEENISLYIKHIKRDCQQERAK